MSVPAEHTWLFWDVDSSAIDVTRDRRYVLGRVLERGRMVDVRWVVREYGLEGVREFFQAGAHPEVSRATVCLWRAFFNDKSFNDNGDEWLAKPSWRTNSVAPWID